jgi:hypothetical protein
MNVRRSSTVMRPPWWLIRGAGDGSGHTLFHSTPSSCTRSIHLVGSRWKKGQMQ